MRRAHDRMIVVGTILELQATVVFFMIMKYSTMYCTRTWLSHTQILRYCTHNSHTKIL